MIGQVKEPNTIKSCHKGQVGECKIDIVSIYGLYATYTVFIIFIINIIYGITVR